MSAGKLPEGWVPCKLEDTLLKIVGGGTPSKTIPEYYQGDIPWMSVKDMNKHTLTDTVDHITPDAVKNSSTNIIPAGIPIIATRMSLGKIVTASFDSAINQDLKALFLTNDIERNFFLHWYRSQAQLIGSLGTGTTVKGIRLEVLNSLSMNLPPLAEQKIIAEKLDTLLAQVDRTKARLEQIPKILKRFRQAVLAAAVNGKLLHCINEKSKFISLGSIAEDIRYGTSKKCSELEGSIAVLRIPNIGHGYVINKNLKYADFDSKEIKALTLSEGDLLLIRSNGSIDLVGKVAVISEADINYLYAGYLIRVRLDLDKAVPKYISYCLQSPQLRQVIENVARSTSGVNNINSKELASLELPLPLTPEQHEIVRRVEQLLSYADTIEKQVNNALARVNNLTQSILAKAFRGELTAQWRAENPELISGENSAAALLEKIKAERAASTGKKATRKKL